MFIPARAIFKCTQCERRCHIVEEISETDVEQDIIPTHRCIRNPELKVEWSRAESNNRGAIIKVIATETVKGPSYSFGYYIKDADVAEEIRKFIEQRLTVKTPIVV